MPLDCQLGPTGEPKRPPRERRTKHRFVGCREQMEIKRVEQVESNQPDPWLSRKFVVAVVVGVFAYSYYVFVVRLCIPMIKMQDNRLGAEAQGLVYLVVYHVLFVLFCWSYVVVVSTPPGFAKDYVAKTEPPPEDAEYVTVAGQRFEDQPVSPRASTQVQAVAAPSSTTPIDPTARPGSTRSRRAATGGAEQEDLTEVTREVRTKTAEDEIVDKEPALGALGPAIGTVLDSVTPSRPAATAGSAAETLSPEHSASMTSRARELRVVDATAESDPSQSSRGDLTTASSNPSTTVTFPEQAHLDSRSSPVPHRAKPTPAPFPGPSRPVRPSESTGLSSSARPPSFLHFPDPPESYEPRERLKVERVPPVVFTLTDRYRYDWKEGFLRPDRSHRCRHCAEVVLKMDHHCPWVGGCVGARNYKYFYNFLQAAVLYTLFVFLTVLIAQTLPLASFPPSRPYPGPDPNQLALIGLSFLFLLFTASLFAAHTRMVLLNLTTIEEMGVNRIRQKERNALNHKFGFWAFRAKREHRKAWDRHWGRLGREGNLWWLGSARKNWEMVMGERKIAWILPIPAHPTGDDGLSYVPNPRFSPEGAWRPRKEWPEELRELGLEPSKRATREDRSVLSPDTLVERDADPRRQDAKGEKGEWNEARNGKGEV
ncbi:hypothetical protein JCM10212_003181 [Sporobolomyces blumeae]